MLSRYQFKEVNDLKSFQEEIPNSISFPVNDSAEFPAEVRERAEEIIDGIIRDNSLQDLSELALDVRIQVSFNDEGVPRLNISVFITDDLDLSILEEVTIRNVDPLYEPIRKYFMWQLEKALFVE